MVMVGVGRGRTCDAMPRDPADGAIVACCGCAGRRLARAAGARGYGGAEAEGGRRRVGGWLRV